MKTVIGTLTVIAALALPSTVSADNTLGQCQANNAGNPGANAPISPGRPANLSGCMVP
jgi:hypothetical protein